MLDKRERILSEIKDRLAIYATRVRWEEGKLSDGAEKLYCGLLNAMFDCDLKNMNRERPNFPAIDLGNDQEYVQMEDCAKPVRLGVQVTSTVTGQKIKHSLDEFFDHELNKRFDRLIVLVAGKVKPFDKEPELKEQFDFQTRRDIWDEKKLLEIIGDLPGERLEAVWKFLGEELEIPQSKPGLNLPLRSAMAEGAFVGREKELAEIAERFETERIVVLSGLGGMGKTELAVRYGQQYAQTGKGAVYFVHFRQDFFHTVTDEIAPVIPGLTEQGLDENGKYREAMKVLRTLGREDILILDNADQVNYSALRRELNGLPMKLLLTTRMDVAKAVPVAALNRKDLYTIFEQQEVDISQEKMDELIDAVEGHTLTVDVMARTMRRGRRAATAEKLLTALKDRDLSRGFTKVEIDYAGSPEQARINEHLKAVFRVAELEEEAQRLLRCATLMPTGGMDDELFLAPFAEEAEDRLDDLIEGGWLYMEDGLLRIHPVIRIVCIEVLEPSDEKCGAFLEGISEQYDPHNYEKTKYRQMAEIFTEVADRMEDRDGRWAGNAGFLWNKAGELERALRLELRAVEKRECGHVSPEALATAYNNLGTTCLEMGYSQKALENMLKAMKIRQYIYGEDHQVLAESYNNIGNVYRSLGENQIALQFCLQALEIWMRVNGENHPNIAISYDNIGCIYGALGEYREALKYHQKAAECFERVPGSNLLGLATCYDNMGCIYLYLGYYMEAFNSCQKALGLFERVFDDDHHSIAATCNNIAAACAALDDFQGAVKYICRSVEVAEKRLPMGHPDLMDYLQMREMIVTMERLKKIGVQVPNPFRK